MFPIAILFKKLAFFLSKFLQLLKAQKKRVHENNFSRAPHSGFQYLQFRSGKPDLENQVIIFHAETVLLRSPSLFPYFMLVAFESGGLIRALVLFLLCPLFSIFPHGLSLRIMVMVSFLGLKKENFNGGKAVLPKFFLEDVGKESFEMLRRGKITVAISDLPCVMVESFLGDYLEVDYVVAKEMKCFGAYFLGVREEGRESCTIDHILKKFASNSMEIIGCSSKFGDCEWFSNCKEIYLVSEQERGQWTPLPKDSYPKPLIFHDGRLAFRPTFMATLAMFMWLPFGFALSILRIAIALTLPSNIALFLIHSTGAKLSVSYPNNSFVPRLQEKRKLNKSSKGVLFVCNHKTLLDPLLIFYSLKTPLTAVVYSLSRMSEMLSPIKTVRLTRNREKDSNLMHELLGRGDLVVCPEGTTCREPYLLRFSPLFTEICDEICPVAIDCHVSMFHGTTARGLKSLDPLFFFMNPWPTYSVHFLDMVRCGPDGNGGSKYERANMVQDLIAKELGFTCTRLTRRDKYLNLAGNEGIVKDEN